MQWWSLSDYRQCCTKKVESMRSTQARVEQKKTKKRKTNIARAIETAKRRFEIVYTILFYLFVQTFRQVLQKFV